MVGKYFISCQLGASSRMHAKRVEPGSRTAAYRNLLKHEDLTVAPTRRRIKWGFAALIAALALVGWLLTYWR
jgi:hypothetical protein